jgi:hypothetical protein
MGEKAGRQAAQGGDRHGSRAADRLQMIDFRSPVSALPGLAGRE